MSQDAPDGGYVDDRDLSQERPIRVQQVPIAESPFPSPRPHFSDTDTVYTDAAEDYDEFQRIMVITACNDE